jgi:hypothetical protein
MFRTVDYNTPESSNQAPSPALSPSQQEQVTDATYQQDVASDVQNTASEPQVDSAKLAQLDLGWLQESPADESAQYYIDPEESAQHDLISQNIFDNTDADVGWFDRPPVLEGFGEPLDSNLEENIPVESIEQSFQNAEDTTVDTANPAHQADINEPGEPHVEVSSTLGFNTAADEPQSLAGYLIRPTIETISGTDDLRPFSAKI